MRPIKEKVDLYHITNNYSVTTIMYDQMESRPYKYWSDDNMIVH